MPQQQHLYFAIYFHLPKVGNVYFDSNPNQQGLLSYPMPHAQSTLLELVVNTLSMPDMKAHASLATILLPPPLNTILLPMSFCMAKETSLFGYVLVFLLTPHNSGEKASINGIQSSNPQPPKLFCSEHWPELCRTSN